MNLIKNRLLEVMEILIDKQNEKGLKTYGRTLDECPYDAYDWNKMLLEEAVDALQYQQKMIGADKHYLIKANIEKEHKIADLESENEELAAAYDRAQRELANLKGAKK